jgi:hypothetical protein
MQLTVMAAANQEPLEIRRKSELLESMQSGLGRSFD